MYLIGQVGMNCTIFGDDNRNNDDDVDHDDDNDDYIYIMVECMSVCLSPICSLTSPLCPLSLVRARAALHLIFDCTFSIS